MTYAQYENEVGPVSEVSMENGDIANGQVTSSVNAEAWNQAESSVTGATEISSLDDLKEKAPELYRVIMDSWAMEIWRQSKHFCERIQQIYREMRREG